MNWGSFIKRHRLIVTSLVLLVPLFFIISNYYFGRLGAFGCFDDCFNIVSGYFILKGKLIFTDFFFNHMPLLAYISALIQKIGNPENVYQLILYHRLFLLFFSIVFWIFLIYRFSWSGLLFVLLFEPFKFYLFGDRFLAESIIVYPIIYLLGIALLKIYDTKEIRKWDFLFISITAWFVIFTRIPFAPLSILLYVIILFGRDNIKEKFISLGLFLSLSFVTLFFHNINDFILNVYTLNKSRVAVELQSKGGNGLVLIKSFLYPFLIFIEGKWNIFRLVLISYSFIFLILLSSFWNKKKFIIFALLTLGLAGIRNVIPGEVFYSAFNLLVWFAIFVFLISFFIIKTENTRLKNISLIVLFLVLLSVNLFPNNIIWERIDRVLEFNDSYATYDINGTIIKTLSDENSTLFVDGGDELIHWVANLDSPYKYYWYTSLMPIRKTYSDARIDMFKTNPPDFYFGNCGERKGFNLPDFIKKDYINFKNNDSPSCIFVKKSMFNSISKKKLERAKELGFSPSVDL